MAAAKYKALAWAKKISRIELAGFDDAVRRVRKRKMEADREQPTDEESILQEAKDLVVDRARPLIYDCIRSEKEEKQLHEGINKALIWLDHVERKLDKGEKAKSYKRYWSELGRDG